MGGAGSTPVSLWCFNSIWTEQTRAGTHVGASDHQPASLLDTASRTVPSASRLGHAPYCRSILSSDPSELVPGGCGRCQPPGQPTSAGLLPRLLSGQLLPPRQSGSGWPATSASRLRSTKAPASSAVSLSRTCGACRATLRAGSQTPAAWGAVELLEERRFPDKEVKLEKVGDRPLDYPETLDVSKLGWLGISSKAAPSSAEGSLPGTAPCSPGCLTCPSLSLWPPGSFLTTLEPRPKPGQTVNSFCRGRKTKNQKNKKTLERSPSSFLELIYSPLSCLFPHLLPLLRWYMKSQISFLGGLLFSFFP